MRSVEVEGNSRVDATRRALELLGAEIDNVKVEVFKEEPRGPFAFLGFKRVTVRVTLLEDNVMERAGEVVKTLVAHLPVPVTASVEMQKNTVHVTLTGAELRQFQRQEDVADALGHVVELILNRHAGNKVTVKAGFAEDAVSREQELANLARATAERVLATGKEEALPPMPARDRRAIHMTLERDGRVVTKSSGAGDGRRVVIYPVGARRPAREAAQRGAPDERPRPPSKRRRPSRGAKPAAPAGAAPALGGGERREPAGGYRRPHRRTRVKTAAPAKKISAPPAPPAGERDAKAAPKKNASRGRRRPKPKPTP
jgi:spoIIIJ-associated protein